MEHTKNVPVVDEDEECEGGRTSVLENWGWLKLLVKANLGWNRRAVELFMQNPSRYIPYLENSSNQVYSRCQIIRAR